MGLSVTREVRLSSGMGGLRVGLTGPIQPEWGYIVNVKVIDGIVRELLESAPQDPPLAGGLLVDWLHRQLSDRLPPPARLASLEWSLAPELRYFFADRNPPVLTVTCQFEFAAAHRLHVASFSEEQNRREFGKCVDLHGHNYVLDVTVAGVPDAQTGEVYPVSRLREIVHRLVIDPFDHTYLNADAAEFAELNPTVEHLAMIIGKR